jgi:two-component system, sensor histidine kinase
LNVFCLIRGRGILKADRTAMARSRSSKKSAAKPARRRPRRRVRAASVRATEASLVAYAHDIRTTLTGILALSELLVSSSLGDRERRWASGIKASAEHLSALTTLMIDAAKADGGTLTLREDAFSPRRLIEAAADSLSARAETKGLVTAVTVADDLPDILVGDAVRLRAALENLIDNAVKFTERGTVRLDVRAVRAPRGRAKVVVAVSDSGIGLKPAEIKRLFRPFTQANADIARRYGGTGLGLAVVKALAKLMGGDLTVTSGHGRGSSFRLSALFAVATAGAAGNTPPPRTAIPARRLAVLCVEDNPYGRVILNTILTELGHRADFAASGEEAAAAVARGYDAVLMDVTLPGIDGLEATRRIRALAGAAARTPIVGISGRTEAGDETAARAAGMDAYLRKPLSPSALSEALAAVVPQ